MNTISQTSQYKKKLACISVNRYNTFIKYALFAKTVLIQLHLMLSTATRSCEALIASQCKHAVCISELYNCRATCFHELRAKGVRVLPSPDQVSRLPIRW